MRVSGEHVENCRLQLIRSIKGIADQVFGRPQLGSLINDDPILRCPIQIEQVSVRDKVRWPIGNQHGTMAHHPIDDRHRRTIGAQPGQVSPFQRIRPFDPRARFDVSLQSLRDPHPHRRPPPMMGHLYPPHPEQCPSAASRPGLPDRAQIRIRSRHRRRPAQAWQSGQRPLDPQIG